MEAIFPLFLFSLFLVIPVAALVLAIVVPRLSNSQRQPAYRAFCESRGYEYTPEHPNASAPYTDVVGMFKSGSKQGWRQEIRGQLDGRPFSAFEYQYVAGSGRRETAFSRAMMHWALRGTSLPLFSLEPASSYLFRIGHDPISVDFQDDPAFAKAYVLRGTDHSAIQARFTPAVRAALVAMPGQFVAGCGTDLFWWQDRQLPAPDKLEAFLNQGTRVVDLFA